MYHEFHPELKINKPLVFERMRVSQTSKIYHKVNQLYENLVPIVKQLVDYQAVYALEESTLVFEDALLNDCTHHVFCFVTVGQPICDEVNRLFEVSNFLEGYILNEMANEVILDATNQLYAHLKTNLKAQGLILTKRYSPGECHLSMDYQKTILGVLQKYSSIQASLTSAFMIKPEKSTLFLYGADANITETDVDFDCKACPSLNCPYRRI